MCRQNAHRVGTPARSAGGGEGNATLAGRKAFTLIELLVVIAIIAVLVSILVPSMSVAREFAKWTKCASNMNTIGKAIYLYCGENEDWMPFTPDGTEFVATYSIGLDKAPVGVGILVSENQLGLGAFEPLTSFEVDEANPVTEVQWRLDPAPGTVVYTHFLYRQLDAGASPQLCKNTGMAIIGDLNCESTHATTLYESHKGRYCHLLKADGGVSSHENEDGQFTLDDMTEAQLDLFFDNADNSGG